MPGRPHIKQTKLVKLINMPFFVAAELSAEESTDHVSRTYLLKVPQHAEKSVYTVYMVLFSNSFRRSLFSGRPLFFGLPWRSLVWAVWIFIDLSSLLLKAFSLKAWRKKQATENAQDMMVQRKIIPCCLPPGS